MNTTKEAWTLDPDRCFSAKPSQRRLARRLIGRVELLPLICPHGHVPPRLLADPAATLGTPADLFVIPDHYVTRMLYSQGVSLEALGVPTRDGTPVETDPRTIWRCFAEHFHLFRGTPTGLWLKDELIRVFGIERPLTAEHADVIYDELSERLSDPAYSPRALFKRFHIEVLCTTDPATAALDGHCSLHAEGWTHIRLTFRPDAVTDLAAENWKGNLDELGRLVGNDIGDYRSFVGAHEFVRLGCAGAANVLSAPLFRTWGPLKRPRRSS